MEEKGRIEKRESGKGDRRRRHGKESRLAPCDMRFDESEQQKSKGEHEIERDRIGRDALHRAVVCVVEDDYRSLDVEEEQSRYMQREVGLQGSQKISEHVSGDLGI
ncbi:hypothetical protein L1887_40400 [Cichorium endivia]|nr:hypothetical protein L1887_40400 [Cichorium endivia]